MSSLALLSEFADSRNGSQALLPAQALCLEGDALHVLLGDLWHEAYAFDWGEMLWVDEQGRELSELSVVGYKTTRENYPKRLGVWKPDGGLAYDEIHFGVLDFDAFKNVLHLRTVRKDNQTGTRTATAIAYLEDGLWRPIDRNWPIAAAIGAQGMVFCAPEGLAIEPPRVLQRTPGLTVPSGPRTRLSALANG